MASYYYLMSSLPMLRADAGMPFGYDRFLEMCQGNVSGKTYALLRDLTVDSTQGPLVREWAQFYGSLAAEMKQQRCQRLGKPCSQERTGDSDAVRIVSAVMSAKNPLEAELMLLELELSKLDQLIGIHTFDEYALFGYALKLRLMQRLTVFNKEKGQAEFSRLMDGIRTQISST